MISAHSTVMLKKRRQDLAKKAQKKRGMQFVAVHYEFLCSFSGWKFVDCGYGLQHDFQIG